MLSPAMFRHSVSTIDLEPGATLFAEGDAGDCMYLVKKGQVEIRHGDQVLDVIGPGGIFGEMALIRNEPRSASAIAQTRCRLLPVDEERFLFLVQQTPYFSLQVMGLLAERLRRQIQAPDQRKP